MSSRKVCLHPEAAAEAEACYRWYRERSPAAAHAFSVHLDAAIKLIQRFPEIWPEDQPEIRRFCFPRSPYLIYYVVGAEEILVLAIAQPKRRPGDWQRRQSS